MILKFYGGSLRKQCRKGSWRWEVGELIMKHSLKIHVGALCRFLWLSCPGLSDKTFFYRSHRGEETEKRDTRGCWRELSVAWSSLSGGGDRVRARAPGGEQTGLCNKPPTSLSLGPHTSAWPRDAGPPSQGHVGAVWVWLGNEGLTRASFSISPPFPYTKTKFTMLKTIVERNELHLYMVTELKKTPSERSKMQNDILKCDFLYVSHKYSVLCWWTYEGKIKYGLEEYTPSSWQWTVMLLRR